MPRTCEGFGRSVRQGCHDGRSTLPRTNNFRRDEFEPGLIDETEKYDVNGLFPPGTLSSADKEWALLSISP